jgi:hypothetical protein
MFNNLGIEWASTLLGCLAVLCIPIPVLFYLFGKKLRQKSKFAPTMTKKPAPEEETSESEDDPHDNMTALHASKSRVHHDLPMKSRTRGSSAGTDGNTGVFDVEKNLSGAEKKQD